MLETQELKVGSLTQEAPLQEEKATHSSILAWKIPWTEEPGGPEVHGVIKNWTRLGDKGHVASIMR